jgi:rod shape-determining protein MreB
MSRAMTLARNLLSQSMLFTQQSGEMVVDLGSYHTRVMQPNDDDPRIIPSCLVQARESGRIVSIGQDAKEIVGRNVHDLEIVPLVKEGNFTDYRLAKIFLEFCFNQKVPKNVYFFVSPNMNEVQYRSLLKITKEYGIGRTILLVRPLIAALAKEAGASLHSASSLQLLIDCGYESTSISILQFGKVLQFHTVWYGGKDLTQDIQHFLKIKHHIEIGAQSAERLKQECAKVIKSNQETSKKEFLVVIRGRDVMTSLPKSIKLPALEFRPLFERYVEAVMEQLAVLMQELGPELIEEVVHRGFLVYGGMAVVDLLIEKIEQEYGSSVHRPQYPDLLYHQGFKAFVQLPYRDQKQYHFSLARL